MSYHDLLDRYGSEQESAEQRYYIYVVTPKKLSTSKEVAGRDKDAANKIAELQKAIADLQDYRVALAKRYAELEIMLYTRALKLERVPHWKSHIDYIITIKRIMEDGTADEELRESYSGKERAAAFKRYEALRKQYPGIKAEKDIARRSWE